MRGVFLVELSFALTLMKNFNMSLGTGVRFFGNKVTESTKQVGEPSRMCSTRSKFPHHKVSL
jgi:hypothetical protein